MLPMAKSLITQSLRSVIALSQNNYNIFLHDKESFSVPEGIIQWSNRKAFQEWPEKIRRKAATVKVKV